MRITPTPKGAGLLLLCAWQLAPILAMIRHSSLLFPHYLLVVMPGPFILAGYFLSKLCTRIRASYLPLRPALLYGLYGLASLIVIAQLAGSVASIRDMDHGNFSDILANGVRYNDLHSLQQVLHDADQLAEQRHLKRIFIGADFSTENMMYYFGEHMQHQTTVFSTENCLLLPSQTDGPAILILPPSNPIDTKLAEKTGARLLQSSSRLSGAPFKIYEIYPSATQLSSPENTLAQSIQLLPQGSVDRLGDHQTSWLTSKWIILRNHPSSYNMTYSYRFNVMLNHRATSTLDSTCTFSTAHAGDQILAVSMLSKQDTPPLFATVKAFSYNETPDTPMFGIFHLESHRRLLSQISNLQTSTGKRELTLKLK